MVGTPCGSPPLLIVGVGTGGGVNLGTPAGHVAVGTVGGPALGAVAGRVPTGIGVIPAFGFGGAKSTAEGVPETD